MTKKIFFCLFIDELLGVCTIRPKISIIMPVFNVEDYITRSVESVIAQKDFEDFEIIIVNDGTKDRSIEKIESLIEAYPNILLVEQKNSGVSEARNTGVRFARGEFISFIDSDDWIEPRMLSEMYEAAARTDSEIAVCNMRRVYEQEASIEPETKRGFRDNTVIKSRKVIDYYFEHKKVAGYPVNKIYKKDLFNKNRILYPKDKIYEDISTTFELIWHSKNIIFLKSCYYNYFQSDGSITRSLNMNIWDLIENVYRIKSSLIQKDAFAEYEDKFQMLLVNQLFRIQLELQKNKKNEIYQCLRMKVDSELEKISLLEIMVSADIKVFTKIKFLFMKLRLTRLLDFLLMIKGYKNGRHSIGRPKEIKRATTDLYKEGGK